jgi:ribonucleotide reductase beta subunit family protein with ferritin-like domain
MNLILVYMFSIIFMIQDLCIYVLIHVYILTCFYIYSSFSLSYILGIQNKHFLKSEELAASIKNKTIISKLSYKCEDEKSKLLASLKNEKNEKNESFRVSIRKYENCSLTV